MIIRWFSYAVMIYMLLGIIWWGKLLYNKNSNYYDLLLTGQAITESERQSILKERSRQEWMILGEGAVLGLALLSGLWIINRSATRQISLARQQSNFLLSVSHELKSPIAAIKLAIQTLLRPNIQENTREAITHNAQKDVLRLENHVQNILLSTKLDEQPLELLLSQLDLRELIHKIIQEYPLLCERIKVIGSDNLNVTINGDANYLRLAVKNVIDNALQHSPSTSIAVIEIRSEHNNQLLTISNEGVAISRDEQQKIFEKFYRSKSISKEYSQGTGLGLFLSREIIKAHGGEISIDPSYAQGVRVQIKLPQV